MNQSEEIKLLKAQAEADKMEIAALKEDVVRITRQRDMAQTVATNEGKEIERMLGSTLLVQLSDEQIDKITQSHGTGGWQTVDDMRKFARAVLAAATPAASVPAASEGWTDNTGDEPMVLVDLEFRDGRIENGEYAGSYYWQLTGRGEDIVRWRPAAPTQAEGQSHD